MSALARRLTEDAPPLSGRRPDVHPELERIVHRALTRDREARYATAAEMREDLEAFLAEVHPKTTRVRLSSGERPASAAPTIPSVAPVPAPPLARPEPPVQTVPAALAPPRRPPWLWPAAGLLVLVALAAGALFLTRGRGPQAVPLPTPAIPAAAPAPAPTAGPTRVEVPTPTAPPTEPTPSRADTAAAAPARARAAREAPARAPASPPVSRGAVTKPDVEEEVPIALSPEQERECGGQAVGISVVIGKDGSLKSRHVISPVSPVCDALALEALSRYRFRAARDEQGQPAEGRFGLSIRF